LATLPAVDAATWFAAPTVVLTVSFSNLTDIVMDIGYVVGCVLSVDVGRGVSYEVQVERPDRGCSPSLFTLILSGPSTPR
jgi:hypothetical protein